MFRCLRHFTYEKSCRILGKHIFVEALTRNMKIRATKHLGINVKTSVTSNKPTKAMGMMLSSNFCLVDCGLITDLYGL